MSKALEIIANAIHQNSAIMTQQRQRTLHQMETTRMTVEAT